MPVTSDFSTLRMTLRRVLGDGLALGYCAVGTGGPLWPEEMQAMGRAIPARHAEFAAGRSAARSALAVFGESPGAIPMQLDRAPHWPVGFCGSITHHAGHALAVVGPLKHIASIGVDLTRFSDMMPDVAVNIAFGAETALPPAAVFAAKEAAFKALFPLMGEIWPFDALEIAIRGDRFSARLARPAGPLPLGHMMTGAVVQEGDFVIALSSVDVRDVS